MKIGSAFDSIAKIEGEPTDWAAGKLVEHVSVEAFVADHDQPGNYIMDIRSTLPSDLAEREKVAAKLSINIQDNAVPFLPSAITEPTIAQVGFELRNSIILHPRRNSGIDDTAHSLGISTKWERDGREHLFRVRLSVGWAAISSGIYRLGIDNLEAYEAPETKYEGEELALAVETGKVLVCKRPALPETDKGAAFVWPLHDNVFHLYSNVLLQTPEFTSFVKAHGANRTPGELDTRLAYAGARLHSMADENWYSHTATTDAPYGDFRNFLLGFIDPQSPGAIQLSKELDARGRVRDLIERGELSDEDIEALHQNRAIMDREGNMLDQLTPVSRSIIARFVRLA